MTIKNKNEIFNEDILLITFGGFATQSMTKARVKKINDGEKCFYQEERIIENKAYHKNIDTKDLSSYFEEVMHNDFRNSVIYTAESDYYIRKNKKGVLTVMKRAATKADLSPKGHNTEKNYLIPEGRPVPFLVELGIMSVGGQVHKKHYSKFRQINRFLELIDDVFKMFRDRSEVNIYDMCCGKGYLTLAMHYYFDVIKKKRVIITGIDLKKDVIQHLNKIVENLKLENVDFLYSDISDADIGSPDLVVALHACDVATDIALSKAVAAGTGLILAVPCCQHELFSQIKNENLSPILKYGIMKDKFTELTTNALRGLALEVSGYKVKMIEFTSIEHTMKNIMIKAIKSDKVNHNALKEFENFSTMLNVRSSADSIIKIE